MSERNGSSFPGTGTAEIPVVRPAPTTTTQESGAVLATPERDAPNIVAEHPHGDLAPGMQAPGIQAPGIQAPGIQAPGMQPTAPVTTVRPRPRMPRRGPMTVMGPWAPVAGGLLGLLLGVATVLFLADSAESFEDRLALAFVVLGLGMLGTSGILLADEVRMMRQRAREAVVRPAAVEATAGLLSGMTPARLLLVASTFVLFLAAYVTR
jgi:hypothetical protein